MKRKLILFMARVNAAAKLLAADKWFVSTVKKNETRIAHSDMQIQDLYFITMYAQVKLDNEVQTHEAQERAVSEAKNILNGL